MEQKRTESSSQRCQSNERRRATAHELMVAPAELTLAAAGRRFFVSVARTSCIRDLCMGVYSVGSVLQGHSVCVCVNICGPILHFWACGCPSSCLRSANWRGVSIHEVQRWGLPFLLPPFRDGLEKVGAQRCRAL